MTTDHLEPTPLDEVPLHGFPLSPGQWWACQHPERRPDGFDSYDGRCRACVVAAEAAASHADRPYEFKAANDAGLAQLSHLVERSKRYLEEQT